MRGKFLIWLSFFSFSSSICVEIVIFIWYQRRVFPRVLSWILNQSKILDRFDEAWSYTSLEKMNATRVEL